MAVTALVGSALVAPAVASAQTAAPPTPVAVPSVVVAGTTTVVSGLHCSPDLGPTSIFVSLADPSGKVIDNMTVNPAPDGSWRASVTVPSNAVAGKYRVYSTCDEYFSEFYYPSIPLTVTASATSLWRQQAPINGTGPGGQFGAVSCGAANSCMAVGTHVNISGVNAPAAESWNGSKWTSAALPVPGGGVSYDVGGVSCPSATACTAVGGFVQSSGRQVALAWTWNGTKWAYDLPVNPTGGSSVSLSAVSCTATASCTAVGSYRAYVGTQYESIGLAESWNGTAWALQVVPDPVASGLGPFSLGSVSCVGSTCMAVGSGSYGGSSVVAQWNGTTWTSGTLPVAATTYYFTVSSVSCTSTTSCVAVGYADGYSGETSLTESWNGTTWTPGTAATVKDGFDDLGWVSCGTSSSCVAVGYQYNYATGAYSPLAELWNGSKWTVQKVPAPKGATEMTLAAVACPLAGTCSAVGSYVPGATGSAVSGLPVAVSLASGRWTSRKLPVFTGIGSNSLPSVSCASVTMCIAVGSGRDASGNPTVLAQVWNGTSWTAQTIGAPTGVLGSSLTSVSCPVVTTCMAVGGEVTTSYASSPLAELWNGTSWTVVPLPTPTNAGNVTLTSVSCSGPTACVAVGSYTDTTTYSEMLLAENWDGSTWTASTVASLGSSESGGLQSVSCTAVTACTAVGSLFSSSTYATVPLVETWNGTSWAQSLLTNALSLSYGTGLTSVSCTSATACTAIGSSSVGPLAEIWNGTAWSAQSPASVGYGTQLTSISCTTANSCTGVGAVATFGFPGQLPVVEQWDGTNWTLPALPSLPDAASGQLNSVSCVGVGECVALGSLRPGGILALGEGGA